MVYQIMFDDFLYNFYRSIKLDKNLYKDKKIFENLSLFFSGLVIIISGFAGLYAQNTFVESLEATYGINNIPTASFFTVVFSSILGWIIWTALIYIVGAKLFSGVNTKANLKNILIAVGYGHAPAIFRFLAVLPELIIPIVLITQIWILLSIAIGIKETLNFRSNFKSIGVVIIVFFIMLLAFVYIMSISKLIPVS